MNTVVWTAPFIAQKRRELHLPYLFKVTGTTKYFTERHNKWCLIEVRIRKKIIYFHLRGKKHIPLHTKISDQYMTYRKILIQCG